MNAAEEHVDTPRVALALAVAVGAPALDIGDGNLGAVELCEDRELDLRTLFSHALPYNPHTTPPYNK
jgi:hypothetical protein